MSTPPLVGFARFCEGGLDSGLSQAVLGGQLPRADPADDHRQRDGGPVRSPSTVERSRSPQAETGPASRYSTHQTQMSGWARTPRRLAWSDRVSGRLVG